MHSIMTLCRNVWINHPPAGDSSNRPHPEKRHSLRLGLVSLLLSLSICQGESIRNPGFEVQDGGKLSDWTSEGAVTLNDADFHSGRFGLMMNHPQAKTSTASGSVSAKGGVFHVWMKMDAVNGEGVQIRLLDSGGKVLAEKSAMTGTQEWKRMSLPFDAGKVQLLTVELSLRNASGRVVFDDVSLDDGVEKPQTPAGCVTDPAKNVALGKKVTFFPSPNYPYCTDPEDNLQLTDGELTEGYFWTQKSTVGWVSTNARVIIDLGQIEPIEGFVVHSVGGGAAGATFPAKFTCMVSDDGENFHEAAVMTSEHLFEGGQEWHPHAFSTGNLRTRGRYVLIDLERTGPCVFTDEIEVHRGGFDSTSVTFDGPARSRREMAFATQGLTPDSFLPGHFPESPHVDWAAPLAGKPLKAIVLNFIEGMRDVVEVAQRLGMDYTPVSHWSYYKTSPLPSLAIEQIEEALPTSELMLVGASRWQMVPPELLEKIRQRVRDGMGLVVIGASTSDWLDPIRDVFQENPLPGDEGMLDLIPMTLIPGYHKPEAAHFQLGTYGKGRVALVNPEKFTRPATWLLPKFELRDYVDDTNGPLEYYFAAFNKLLLWAAGRDNKCLTAISVSPETLNVKVTPGQDGTRLRVTVRDPFFREIATQTRDIPAGEGAYEFQMPGGMRGIHSVDVWLSDAQGGILDFGSGFYTRDAAARIEGVTLAKSLFPAGEPVEATIKIQGAAEDHQLRVSLFDTDGREVSPPQLLSVAGAGEVKASLPYLHPQTLAAKLFVELVKGDEVLDKRLERAWIETPAEHDFTFIGWYALSNQPIANFCMKLLRGLGVDSYVALWSVERAESAAYGNIRFAPENAAPVWPPKTVPKDLVRVPCLSDPAHRKTVAQSLERQAAETRKFGTTEWSLGDEERLGDDVDYCFSPSCQSEFRLWLQKQYPGLQALNESWGSSFKTWDEVMPATLQELKPGAPIGSWLDHRRYMESLFADYHARGRKSITSQIPAARVGLSGTQEPTSFNGYDWWKLMHAVDHISGYGGVQSSLQQSFKQPGTFVTTFIGYDNSDVDEQGTRSAPWRLLFDGADGINYFTLIYDTRLMPVIRPDLSLTRKAGWLFEEVAELKAGIGLLFMEAKPENDGIAIHYSPPSLHSATAAGLYDLRDRKKNFGVNMINLVKILRDSHYQCRFLSEDQIKGGDLSSYKVLFLPWSSAIGEEEAEAIRKFVRNGGTVIADSFCGVRDAHGKPAPMLEDLFGVRQSLEPPDLKNDFLTVNGKKIPVSSGSTKIELKGGTARGEMSGAPAYIVREYGKGRAIFLNASFSNYADQVAGGEGGEVQVGKKNVQTVTAPIRGFVTELLKEAGVPVPMPVSAGNEDASEIELSRLRLGNTTLLGAVRAAKHGSIDRGDLLPSVITLDKPMYAYDSRSGKFFGKTGEIQDSLCRGEPKAYALLPYEVTGLQISGKKNVVPGEAAKFQVAIQTKGKADTHVIHLALRGPDGKERPWYAQNVVARKGSAQAVVPFAYNDPEGEWTLVARDAATGVTNSKTVRLQKL